MSQPVLPPFARPNVPLRTPSHGYIDATIADGVVDMLAEGDPDILFQRCTLEGKKVVGGEPTDNAGDVQVYVRIAGTNTYSYAFTLAAGGASIKYDAPENGPRYNKLSFKFKVAADGDGIHYFLD